MQKHLWLYALGAGEYLYDKYALWIDFRTIYENTLHGTSNRIGSNGGGIILQIEKKKDDSSGALISVIQCYMQELKLVLH